MPNSTASIEKWLQQLSNPVKATRDAALRDALQLSPKTLRDLKDRIGEPRRNDALLAVLTFAFILLFAGTFGWLGIAHPPATQALAGFGAVVCGGTALGLVALRLNQPYRADVVLEACMQSGNPAFLDAAADYLRLLRSPMYTPESEAPPTPYIDFKGGGQNLQLAQNRAVEATRLSQQERVDMALGAILPQVTQEHWCALSAKQQQAILSELNNRLLDVKTQRVLIEMVKRIEAVEALPRLHTLLQRADLSDAWRRDIQSCEEMLKLAQTRHKENAALLHPAMPQASAVNSKHLLRPTAMQGEATQEKVTDEHAQ